MVERPLIPARYRREGLTARSFACPRVRVKGTLIAKYPLKSTSKGKTTRRVKNAMARYQQKATVKCKGGQRKICAAYRREGLTHTSEYRQQCRR